MASEGDQDHSKTEAFLRKWRQTAFNAGQFQTAIFVGDKLLALTSQLFVLLVLFALVLN